MFLLPILILVALGWAIYKAMHRQAQPVSHTGGAYGAASVRPHAFWPTTALGWSGIAALCGLLVIQVLVNVVQVPFLGWFLVVAAVGLTAGARFVRHDRSPAVLIVLIVAAIATLAALLFLTGEVLVGHD